MHIDSDFIKNEREKRAWSQDQLATAAGIGLRTIQRIESTGIASNETAKSLAAVFECSLDDLRVLTPRRKSFWKHPLLASGIVTACSILGIVMITSRVHTKEIMLDVVFNSGNGNGSSTLKMLTANGKETEARFEKESRLLFKPTLEDNNLILVAVDIYDYDGKDFKLVSQPKVLTRDGKEAHIQMSFNDKLFDIKIKPQEISLLNKHI